MNRAKLISDVRHLLDEQNLLAEYDVDQSDTLPVDGRIEALYTEAMNHTRTVAPIDWLEAENAVNASIQPDLTKGTGRIILPDDFLRLSAIRLKGWRRPVTELTEENSQVSQLQLTAATRGGTCSPVCVVDTGHTNITYYSLPRWYDSHAIELFLYIPKSKSIEDDKIKPQGYALLCHILALDVAASFGRNVKQFETHITQMLQ